MLILFFRFEVSTWTLQDTDIDTYLHTYYSHSLTHSFTHSLRHTHTQNQTRTTRCAQHAESPSGSADIRYMRAQWESQEWDIWSYSGNLETVLIKLIKNSRSAAFSVSPPQEAASALLHSAHYSSSPFCFSLSLPLCSSPLSPLLPYPLNKYPTSLCKACLSICLNKLK